MHTKTQLAKNLNVKIATRKSNRVAKAIKKMMDEGAIVVPGSTWEDVWDDIVHSPGCYECVYLIGRHDSVWGYFPCPNSVQHGTVSLSSDGVPYIWLMDRNLPIEGETICHSESGAKYYLFLDERRRGLPLDGYLVKHGDWQADQSHLVHWETVREAGV